MMKKIDISINQRLPQSNASAHVQFQNQESIQKHIKTLFAKAYEHAKIHQLKEYRATCIELEKLDKQYLDNPFFQDNHPILALLFRDKPYRQEYGPMIAYFQSFTDVFFDFLQHIVTSQRKLLKNLPNDFLIYFISALKREPRNPKKIKATEKFIGRFFSIFLKDFSYFEHYSLHEFFRILIRDEFVSDLLFQKVITQLFSLSNSFNINEPIQGKSVSDHLIEAYFSLSYRTDNITNGFINLIYLLSSIGLDLNSFLDSFTRHLILKNNNTNDVVKIIKIFSDTKLKTKINQNTLDSSLHYWVSHFQSHMYPIATKVIELFMKLGANAGSIVSTKGVLFSLYTGYMERINQNNNESVVTVTNSNRGWGEPSTTVGRIYKTPQSNEVIELSLLKLFIENGADTKCPTVINTKKYNIFELIALENHRTNYAVYREHERYFLEHPKYQVLMQEAKDNLQKLLRQQGADLKQMHEDTQSTHRAAVHITTATCGRNLVQRYLGQYPAAEKEKAVQNCLNQIHKYLVERILTAHALILSKNPYGIDPALHSMLIEDFQTQLKMSLENTSFLTQPQLGNEEIWNLKEFAAFSWFKLSKPPVSWKESISQITIDELLASVWLAIHDKEVFDQDSQKTQLNELVSAFQSFWLNPVCPAGNFNTIVLTLDKVHPAVEINQIGNSVLFDFIRDFYEEKFRQLPLERKANIKKESVAQGNLPKAFIEEFKQEFYKLREQDIKMGYIKLSYLDDFFSDSFDLMYFNNILNYVEFVPQINQIDNRVSMTDVGDDDVEHDASGKDAKDIPHLDEMTDDASTEKKYAKDLESNDEGDIDMTPPETPSLIYSTKPAKKSTTSESSSSLSSASTPSNSTSGNSAKSPTSSSSSLSLQPDFTLSQQDSTQRDLYSCLTAEYPDLFFEQHTDNQVDTKMNAEQDKHQNGVKPMEIDFAEDLQKDLQLFLLGQFHINRNQAPALAALGGGGPQPPVQAPIQAPTENQDNKMEDVEPYKR